MTNSERIAQMREEFPHLSMFDIRKIIEQERKLELLAEINTLSHNIHTGKAIRKLVDYLRTEI